MWLDVSTCKTCPVGNVTPLPKVPVVRLRFGLPVTTLPSSPVIPVRSVVDGANKEPAESTPVPVSVYAPPAVNTTSAVGFIELKVR